MDINDDKLNKILEKKAFEAPTNDFAQRIITASLPVKSASINEEDGFLTKLQAFFRMIAMPQPALILSACLVLGVSFGFTDTSSLNNYDADSYDVSEFLYIEGELI